MLIDSHTHLTIDRILKAGTVEEIISKAGKAGVAGMLSICCRIEKEFPALLEIAENHNNVWCSVGTHPHSSGEEEEKQVSLENLCKLANSKAEHVIAIGETGLDFYYNNSSREDQIKSFEKHIKAAIETGLPLVIHSREADIETMEIIRKIAGNNTGGKLKGVLHSFTSGRDMAMQALEMGLYISFSGIVTFKSAKELRELAKEIPTDKMLVETDAPFLAPEPFRGKVNEPAMVIHTAKALAKIKNIPEEELEKTTTANFFRLFDRAKLK